MTPRAFNLKVSRGWRKLDEIQATWWNSKLMKLAWKMSAKHTFPKKQQNSLRKAIRVRERGRREIDKTTTVHTDLKTTRSYDGLGPGMPRNVWRWIIRWELGVEFVVESLPLRVYCGVRRWEFSVENPPWRVRCEEDLLCTRPGERAAERMRVEKSRISRIVTIRL